MTTAEKKTRSNSGARMHAKRTAELARQTPVWSALREDSDLRILVADGFGAIKASERDCFDHSVRSAFGDSLDLDAAMQASHPQAHRWDYLLGHTDSGHIVAVETHSAKQDEMSTLISKRDAARDQLRVHLHDGARVMKWLWVTSGKVHFANTERVRRQLDQHGIEFVGTKVLPKHLPVIKPPQVRTRKAK